jgi:hypothetical protein
MNKLAKLAIIGLLLAPGQGRRVFAAEGSSTQTDAYQNSVEEDRLRAQTARVRKEMMALLDQYKAYPSAAAEVAELQLALQSLGTLSDKDMLEVVQTLRQASQAGAAAQAKDEMLNASRGQKSIQIVLRQLADRLAQEKDETALRKRLTDLELRQMANQHQTQELVDGHVKPWEVERATKLVIDEQAGIKEEVTQTLAALTKLSQNPQALARPAFLAALGQGENLQVATQAAIALTDATAKNLPQTVADDNNVVNGVQAMLLALNSTESAQDRIQAMADTMKAMAAKEEQLTTKSKGVYFMAQHEIKDPQLSIDDQTRIALAELAQISPPASDELGHAHQSMQSIDNFFKKDNFMEQEENRGLVLDAERAAGQSFAETAAILQKQAEAMGGTSSASSAGATADSTSSEIQDATNLIMTAQDKLETAELVTRQGKNPGAAKDLLGKANEDLLKASGKVADLGNAVSKDVGSHLKAAEDGTGAIESKVGTTGDPMRESWGVGGAKQEAGKALAGLQDAMNRLAAQSAVRGSSQSNGSSMPGSPAGGAGAPPANQNTNLSVLASFTDQEREALSALEHESAPPEYNTMVQQYRKNLANGDLPTP